MLSLTQVEREYAVKKELKISTLTIVCVLCAGMVSGAHAASSVRNLGGSGTYSSAASASSANSGARAATSVRGGSVRVTPTSNQSGSSASISAGSTTSGRVATSPRLSIGHYLGGGTSVSGGSSLRPQNPGSGSSVSGGGSSGGEIDTGTLEGLREQIDVLLRDVEDLQGAVDTKQDVLTTGNNFVSIENNEILVDVDELRYELGAGCDFIVEGGNIVRDCNGDKTTIIAVEDIVGDGYVSLEDMNAAIADAVADVADTYATKDELTTATADMVTSGDLANYPTREEVEGMVGDIADVELDSYLTKTEASTTYVNTTDGTAPRATADAAGNVITDTYAVKADVDVLEREVAAKANMQYVNEELAKKADKSTTLAGYGITDAYTKGEVDSKVANIVAGDMEEALTGKEDVTNKKTTLTNSDTDYPSTSAVTTALAGYATTAQLAEVSGDVAALGSVVNDEENGLTSLAGKIATAVAGAEAAQSAAEAAQSAADGLTSRVATNETNITALQNATADMLTKTEASTTYVNTTDGTAPRATADAAGNNIATTYATKTEISGMVTTTGAGNNKVLGTDGSGATMWYDIAL